MSTPKPPSSPVSLAVRFSRWLDQHFLVMAPLLSALVVTAIGWIGTTIFAVGEVSAIGPRAAWVLYGRDWLRAIPLSVGAGVALGLALLAMFTLLLAAGKLLDKAASRLPVLRNVSGNTIFIGGMIILGVFGMLLLSRNAARNRYQQLSGASGQVTAAKTLQRQQQAHGPLSFGTRPHRSPG